MAKRRRFLVFLLALLTGGLVYAHASPNSALNTSGSDFQRAVEKQTFQLINEYRVKYGVSALRWNDGMAKLARAHSKDMATGEVDFGHDGFNDRIAQVKAMVAGFRGAGENVLFSSDLNDIAAHAVQMWLHSPHHLKNIRGDYNLSGLGVWQGKNGALYFTQIFFKAAEPGE